VGSTAKEREFSLRGRDLTPVGSKERRDRNKEGEAKRRGRDTSARPSYYITAHRQKKLTVQTGGGPMSARKREKQTDPSLIKQETGIM